MSRTVLLAILILPCLTACGTARPRLAEGLRVRPVQQNPDPAWDQRVRERFPVGSNESALLAELHRERFVIDATRASYRSSDIACTWTWRVSWAAENDRITQIAGDYQGVCL